MIQHEVTVHLNRPVEQVFAFLADYQNLQTWQSNLIENEQLTKGPVRIGTRFREIRQTGPGQSEIQAEITYFEPNKGFSTKTITGPQCTVSYSLRGEDHGTQLSYKFVMLTSGMMRLLEPLIASQIRKGTDEDFQKLKHILER
jgi:uncharacterized membrane protein